MFIRKSMFVALGAAAGVLGAYADDPAIEQNFEELDVGALVLAGWTGYGTIEQPATAITLPTAGAPCNTDTHTKNLAVDGWVEANLGVTPNPACNDRQLDMLVKVALPDDPLAGLGDADAKFAIAVDKTDTDKRGQMKYWDGDSWELLFPANELVVEDAWIRVAVIFDSTSKRCKVTVNGSAATTGYASTSSDTLNKGPWYPVLKTTDTIASMKVVGTTALDDLVMGTVANSDYTPSYKDASGHEIVIATGTGDNKTDIPLAWYDKNNIPTSAANTTTGDGSGMTTEQKYITGVANDGSKFELKAMTMTKDDDVVKAKVTLPKFDVAKGYTAKLQTSANNSDWTDSSVTPVSNTEVEVPLSSGNVTYFRLVAVKDPPAS